jgi:radical SAM superfamily enzyme YgiQ (UPF0313 family)
MPYEGRWGQYSAGAGDTFPMGIGAVAGYLEKHSVNVDVIEPDVEKMDEARFNDFILKGGYDVVGISAYTPTVMYAYDTAVRIKRLKKNTVIVFGGSHPTIFPELTMRECPEIDYLIVREGEIPMLHLLRALSGEASLDQTPHLYYRRNGEIVNTGVTCGWIDLDELPMFPYHKFDAGKYVPSPSVRRVLPTFAYAAQRGCPFHCTFCDTSSHGRKVRYRSVDNVVSDLTVLKEKYKVKGITFEGSNFTVNPKYMKELCERLIEKRLGLVWYCMGRTDMDSSLFPLFKQAGCWGVSFGIESANEKTLKLMKKKVSVEKTTQAIRMAHKAGIRTQGSFILGYPGEDEQDVLNTINYACDLDIDIAIFFSPIPLPNTVLYDQIQASGDLKEGLKWSDYSAWLDHNNPIYINPLLGLEKQTYLYNYAFKRFYLRPKYFLKQLRSIRSLDDFYRLAQGFKSVKGLLMKYFQKAFGVAD